MNLVLYPYQNLRKKQKRNTGGIKAKILKYISKKNPEIHKAKELTS